MTNEPPPQLTTPRRRALETRPMLVAYRIGNVHFALPPDARQQSLDWLMRKPGAMFPITFSPASARVLVVTLEVACVTLLVLTQQKFVGTLAALVLLLGLALAVAAHFWMLAGRGNSGIFPEPKPGSQLVTNGPFRWVRHPIYAGELVLLLGLVSGNITVGGCVIWLVLAFVWFKKSEMEERHLTGMFGNYSSYAIQTKRFIPFVY